VSSALLRISLSLPLHLSSPTRHSVMDDDHQNHSNWYWPDEPHPWDPEGGGGTVVFAPEGPIQGIDPTLLLHDSGSRSTASRNQPLHVIPPAYFVDSRRAFATADRESFINVSSSHGNIPLNFFLHVTDSQRFIGNGHPRPRQIPQTNNHALFSQPGQASFPPVDPRFIVPSNSTPPPPPPPPGLVRQPFDLPYPSDGTLEQQKDWHEKTILASRAAHREALTGWDRDNSSRRQPRNYRNAVGRARKRLQTSERHYNEFLKAHRLKKSQAERKAEDDYRSWVREQQDYRIRISSLRASVGNGRKNQG